GTGGGEELAGRLEVPLLAKVPLVPELREGGDSGRPITVVAPESEAAQAFGAAADMIDTQLAPTRRSHPELKIM
ncbi:MAG: P-loop NTPase, partial [Microthrixaceae bacterium]